MVTHGDMVTHVTHLEKTNRTERACSSYTGDCGLVVRVPGCSHRGPGFHSWPYLILCVAVVLERGALSPCEDK
jgi:hypothetical protein